MSTRSVIARAAPTFTHIAFDDFRIVRDNITGGDSITHPGSAGAVLHVHRSGFPSASRPERNREAERQGISTRLTKIIPMVAVLRARTLLEET